MNDILEKKEDIWRERFKLLMEEKGYTQKTFLREYKKRYGGGTQANVSRWLRVGNIVQKDGIAKKIGFPSYETMLNIADLFGVTIGYLTGETNFESFEMEKACQHFGIDEDTGKALHDITSGKNLRLYECQSREIKATLQYLLKAHNFPRFISGLREYAENLYRKKHPVNHLAEAEHQIKKEIRSLAFQCTYDEQYGEIDDFKANNIEPTDELREAIHMLNAAIEQNYSDEISSELKVKLSEYELQKIYFDLIKDVVLDEYLPEMAIPYIHESELIQLKKID